MSFGDELARQRLDFLPGVAEKLRWYVYALRDPRTGTVFYIGKGVGNRAYDHARSAKASGDSILHPKIAVIKEIHDAGHEVAVEIVRHNLPDEMTAYEVEAAVIDALGHAGSTDLQNAVAGHGHSTRGWSTLESLRHLEALPVEIPNAMRPSVLIRPRDKYEYGMTTDEMWDATRGGWTFRFRNYRYAFCVHNAITRGIWRVTGWDPDPARWGTGRRALEGIPATELWEEYVGRYVGQYLPPKGGRLPYTILTADDRAG